MRVSFYESRFYQRYYFVKSFQYHCSDNMAPYYPLILLILSTVCYSSSAWLTSPTANECTSIPRGGGIRRNKVSTSTSTIEDVAVESDEDSSDTEEDTPFDLEATNKKILIEEIQDIKESQQLIQKQKRRRELDKSLLDKGITRFIEFFENLFSWKVIDV